MTLDHKNFQHAFQLWFICYDRTIFVWDTTIWVWNLKVQKSPNIEKITFKVIQIKILAMHITNQKLRFDTFTVGNVQNNLIEHDLYLMS